MIVVLGCNGMLGTYVTKYFSEFYDVKALARSDFDFYTDQKSIEKALRDNLCIDDILINCAGIIKPQVQKVGNPQTIFINSVLPHILSNWCRNNGVNMIHPATDCVYSGKAGQHEEGSLHDDSDIYGRSKSLGETKNATCIRVSIIGEEKYNKRSLIEWAKSQSGTQVNGFTNHLWNGITCLEWCKIVHEIIKTKCFWDGTESISSPESVTKYELLKMISEVYKLNLDVIKAQHTERCDRTLVSSVSFTPKSIYEQLVELKDFKL